MYNVVKVHSKDFSQLHAAESWCNEFKVADLRVLRDLVHAVMYNVDSVSLEERAPCFKKKKKRKAISLREEQIESILSTDTIR